jgi:hypothetical protein
MKKIGGIQKFMENNFNMDEITVQVADESYIKYVDTILKTIEEAAKIRGTVLPAVHLNTLRKK